MQPQHSLSTSCIRTQTHLSDEAFSTLRQAATANDGTTLSGRWPPKFASSTIFLCGARSTESDDSRLVSRCIRLLHCCHRPCAAKLRRTGMLVMKIACSLCASGLRMMVSCALWLRRHEVTMEKCSLQSCVVPNVNPKFSLQGGMDVLSP